MAVSLNAKLPLYEEIKTVAGRLETSLSAAALHHSCWFILPPSSAFKMPLGYVDPLSMDARLSKQQILAQELLPTQHL